MLRFFLLRGNRLAVRIPRHNLGDVGNCLDVLRGALGAQLFGCLGRGVPNGLDRRGVDLALHVDIRRIIDNPPKSRNEKLASLMRRLRMCEELGTGWDKIVMTCELFQLPAPKIELFEESTRVTLYAEIPFGNILPEDKLWACYLHACVMHVQGENLTNSSLRARFGVSNSSSASISRLIKDAVNCHLIKPLDPNTAPRYMKYLPIWA